MKRVGLKTVFRTDLGGGENEDNKSNILSGSAAPLLPKSFTSFFSQRGAKGLIQKRKEMMKAANGDIMDEKDDDICVKKSQMNSAVQPVIPTPRLRRVNSSSLSIHKPRKKIITLDELYIEILYTIQNMVGCDTDPKDEIKLIKYLQEAFHYDTQTHEHLKQQAIMREEPVLKANLDIKEAKSLLGKDLSGTSDPFCSVFISNKAEEKQYTSYKAKTLDPKWEEEFNLDIENIDIDTIRIDVWNFKDPYENVSDKFRKIHEVKDSRSFKKFIKDTYNASTGHIIHELIGSVEFPIRNVPSSGIHRWFKLEKPDAKSKKFRGQIHVSLTISTNKATDQTAQEHRHLLKILFAHELKTNLPEPFTWNGSFSEESVKILAQHAVQGRLTGAETALARWLVYAHTHCDLPLSYAIFVPILEKLNYALKNDLLEPEEESRFYEVASVFVCHGLEFIKKHRRYIANDAKYVIQVEHIVKCLSLLYAEASKAESEDNTRYIGDIPQLVYVAVEESIQDWYAFIQKEMPMDNNRALKIKTLISLVHILTTSDLKESCMQLHSLFKDTLEIDYIKIAYKVYEEKIIKLCSPLVEETCGQLKPLIFSEDDGESEYINDTLNLGTNLFELYLALQRFVTFGDEIYTKEKRLSPLRNSHIWFHKGVARWLDIALYKAMQRIIKAVELDSLEPVDDLVKHSSSAVDIRTVLTQIKTFWKQLNWPDVEASYTYISKILDDVCRTTIFYADQMCKRVETVSKACDKGEFIVTPELCLSINNIDYVLQYIQPYVSELGMEETIDKLHVLDGEEVANSCRRTLKTLVQNATENVENKILQVLDNVGEKMAPVIQRFLVDGCTLVAYAGTNKDTLISYLDANLILLKDKLTVANFERVLSVIWESSAHSLNDTIQLSIERKKPPQYFQLLLDTLKVLSNFFYGDKLPHDETLLKMKNILQLYASDSSDLIACYMNERYKEQNRTKEFSALGSITVRLQMLPEHLRVEILNARHLKPPNPVGRFQHSSGSKYVPPTIRRRRMKSLAHLSRSQRNLHWVKSKFKSLKDNIHEKGVQMHSSHNDGLCDPYVCIRLIPGNKFVGCPKLKTKVQRQTLFPLFDETFDFVLPNSSTYRMNEAYLLLTIKDRAWIGHGIFVGEALVPLSDIEMTSVDTKLSDLEQKQLPLTRPQDQDSDIILALDSRTFDRLAKDFLVRERRKYGL
ncbi:protein unc-13 homolog 4B [Lepeophtheirus salmonis]|uniref:protein unc-13 homolog 4B n=1 Tax=Lepeophtheirus salmonis TaxID=72036 RepID=UPI001AE2DF85|nr:protein unc-13 homolog 4B-like [Lepeophtheirus salmonis]XP_040580539.1 protein unc-13 homolog 4B-like [Lepeophtheirus salmonis]